MKKVIVIAGMSMALCSAVALADPDPAVVPLDNAAARISEKAAENPDNKGLANALHHIVIDNIPRQQAKRENHPPGQNKAGASDRVQTVERVERVERVEKAERPERPERPDRPDRSAHAGIDRPVPPGHNK